MTCTDQQGGGFAFSSCGFLRIFALSLPLTFLIGQLCVSLSDLPHNGLATDEESLMIDLLVDDMAATTTRDGFGACLMMKEDNDALYEWLAYHYTVLPLRFLVVGSDLDSRQDPATVLDRWKTVPNFHYGILQADEFIHRHGNYYDKFNSTTMAADVPEEEALKENKRHHHHALIHRQKGFLTVCSELLKSQGVHWTLYIDTDEFVVPNRWSSGDEEQLQLGGKGRLSIRGASYEIRRNLPTDGNNWTFLDVILDLERGGNITKGCYTMPRLLVGSLENRTCPEAAPFQQWALKNMPDRYDFLNTLRYVQHAPKGDFSHSKFGKVMMDLSQIPVDTLWREPRNIHRPYADHCGPAVVHFPDAFFFLAHYIGSWQAYRTRLDGRRNRQEWEQRAFVDDGGKACDTSVHSWFPRFLFLATSERRAKYLLGSTYNKETRLD
jgi:hypothetical protein